MKISIKPGRYVVAVSGGVDSVVLLHLLHGLPDLDLVVAHFDHEMRIDSAADEVFVSRLAKSLGLQYVSAAGNLGTGASEALAREKRYVFLYEVMSSTGSAAIITAHHKDDVLETAILNVIRGTNRHGLSSLKSTKTINRPLLAVSKLEIFEYATKQKLEWHEDNTNASTLYKRNYVRHNVLPKFSNQQKAQLYAHIITADAVNAEADRLVEQALASITISENVVDRRRFILLPHAVSREIMAAWLQSNKIGDIDSKMIERLVHAAKSFVAGTEVAVSGNSVICVEKYNLALKAAER